MGNWKEVVVPGIPSKSRGCVISINMETKHGNGYIYFSSGLSMKPGKYKLVAQNGLFGFVNDPGGYKLNFHKGSSCSTINDKALVRYLRNALGLESRQTYRYDAYVENGIVVLNTKKPLDREDVLSNMRRD